jgi:hypothetical protein
MRDHAWEIAATTAIMLMLLMLAVGYLLIEVVRITADRNTSSCVETP